MIDPCLRLADFDYVLPPELIAQQPANERSHSRLLHVDSQGQLHDRIFSHIHSLLRPADLLVFNNTRVMKARLLGQKASGGKLEGLVERLASPHTALMHIKASKAPKASTLLYWQHPGQIDSVATVLGRVGDLFKVQFQEPVLAVLERLGSLPLPPYITHSPTTEDDQRYQTVYADPIGAVAAPTAGLHFDKALLQDLADKGVRQAFVTLHVGAGTFQPVRVERIQNHHMHAEWYTVPQATIDAITQCRAAGGRVIAVGTTSVRALESAALQGGYDSTQRIPKAHQGDTQLFMTPGFDIKVVDGLLTNFHLPQSTLLMLVAAFIGLPALHHCYQHAIAQRYRFFSYGDAMFIEP